MEGVNQFHYQSYMNITGIPKWIKKAHELRYLGGAQNDSKGSREEGMRATGNTVKCKYSNIRKPWDKSKVRKNAQQHIPSSAGRVKRTDYLPVKEQE